MSLQQESRRDGLAQVSPKIGPLQSSILDALNIKDPMICREIMDALCSTELNNIRSRTTELYNAHLVDVVGRRPDPVTRINVSVYAVAKRGQLEIWANN